MFSLFRVIWRKFVIFLIFQFFVEGKDILNLFRPKPNLPQELNDFLNDVQQHKKDFVFIRNLAKNRRRYEKTFAENHNLFAEDLDNQLTLAPYYSKRHNNFENHNLQIEDNLPNLYNPVARSPAFDQENSFRSIYPNERYSKFIHSPVRLRRELDSNYLDSHVKINPNGIYGAIQRPGPKFPGNRLVNDENKYHTGYIVGLEDDDYEDYPELRRSDKKKREVEINIKSDGKLVKKIEEDDNGPKSIILNIKASNSNEKSQILSNAASQAPELTDTSSTNLVQPIKKDLGNGPSNSKTIPSLDNSNLNQNGAQNKNFGVPINSIPANNNGFSNNKNGQPPINQRTNPRNELNAKNSKDSVSQDKLSDIQNHNAQEMSEVLNSEVVKGKYDPYNSKALGGYDRQPNENFGNLRNNNQMVKTMDTAQNNDDKFSGSKEEPNQEGPAKESDFEKVQGVVVDSDDINNNNVKDNKIKYARKRQLTEEKRWDKIGNDVDDTNIPLDVQAVLSDGTANGGLDYLKPLEQEAINLNHPYSGQEIPEKASWEAGDQEMPPNPNVKYEIIVHSTKDIIILPIPETTTSFETDIQQNSDEEEKEDQAARVLGDIVAETIKKEKEIENKESTECKSEKYPHNHQEEEKEEKIEIIQHEKDKEDRRNEDEYHNNKKGRVTEIEILREDPRNGHQQKHEHQKGRQEKRQVVKKKKTKYIIKQKGKDGKSQYSPGKFNDHVPDKSKHEKEKQHHSDDNTLRNRKHMPPVSKYKKKRVRQHPKKRIDRVDKSALVDYYDFNAIYGPPDDNFNFIPAFYKRQLKSVDYEFDPNLIRDVGNHENEEIKKFEKAQEKEKIILKVKDKENRKFQNSAGYRKKFKSDSDYSDEEESFTLKAVSRKVLIKKTLNEFAPVSETTTEDNDDDYNYEDISDMDDDEEDVAYEEEKADNVDVDEQIGSTNESDHEIDRFNLYKLSGAKLAMPQIYTGYTTKEYATEKKYGFSDTQAGKKLVKDDSGDHEEKIDKHEQTSISRGHGSANKKKKKKIVKKPKRNDENEFSDHRIQKSEERNLADDVSSFHGRGNRGFKLVKHKQIKPKNEDGEAASQKGKELKKNEVSEQFEEKPLSNQQKQDIFLRYNPEFQRWPRFVQSDNIYRQLMKRRSLENQKRYFRNAHNINRFPISNEYFLHPDKLEFAKREEPASEMTTAETSSAETEAASSTASEETKTTAITTTEGTSQSPATEESSTEQEEEEREETSPSIKTESADSLKAEENLNGAALPQAAQNILQTANSDIFENTTAPPLEGVESGLSIPGDDHGIGGESTQFRFTTIAEDLTQSTECVNYNKEISPCPDESASHSPYTITSVLPIVHESATILKSNMTRAQYLDLNDIVGGSLPRNIVSCSLSGARGKLRQGLNSGKFNTNLNLSNYNNSAETRIILNEMTNLMLKLKYHSTCQVLPVNLHAYIKLLTRNEMDDPMAKLKTMNEVDFDEHQSSYVFHTGESENVQNKANALRELLNKYNNLPDDCKERAEPVREYIESHLAMIDHMIGKDKLKPSTETTSAENGTTTHSKPKNEVTNLNNSQEKDLTGQIMEEGFNNQKPNANEAIEDKDTKIKREASNFRFPSIYRRELSTSTSPEYGKLAEAVRKMRHRRESVKRIAEIYGRAKRDEVDQIEAEKQSEKENKGFESPLVINF